MDDADCLKAGYVKTTKIDLCCFSISRKALGKRERNVL